MKRSFLILFLLIAPLFAMDEHPWLPPPLEVHSELGYLYFHTDRVQTPLGSFTFIDNNHILFGSFAMTVLPELYIKSYLSFAADRETNLALESLVFVARTQLLDDLCGDWIALTAGLSLAFPPKHIIENLNYYFHGHVNAEFDLTAGKEFHNHQTGEWNWRTWGRFAYGIAERGRPWFHTLVTVDQHLSKHTHISYFSEVVYGFGSRDIVPGVPFRGYGTIAHRMIDLGASFDYEFAHCATLSFLGFLNIYAYNFIEHCFGGSIYLTFHFGP